MHDNFSRLSVGKSGKALGKNEPQSCVHIYKMRSENMLARQSSGRSLQSMDKDEELSSSTSSSRCSVSDDCQTTAESDQGIEMRKLSQGSLNKEGTKSPSLKPTRHMLVIPDTASNKERVVEVNCRSSSITIMDSSAPLACCPSPDSGVHIDINPSPAPTWRNGNRIISNLHSKSSPSVLCDSFSKRSSCPASSILGNSN